MSLISCPHCLNNVGNDEARCRYCGCSIATSKPEADEKTRTEGNAKPSRTRKAAAIAALCIVIPIIVRGGGLFLVRNLGKDQPKPVTPEMLLEKRREMQDATKKDMEDAARKKAVQDLVKGLKQ